MGKGGLNRMNNFVRFRCFQGTNYGRALDVFCQNLTLTLGGQDCGRRIQR